MIMLRLWSELVFLKNAEKISTAGREFLNWNQLSDLFYEKFVW